MNSFIETLNQWGENFLSFSWPMLWQSSLLIVVLFAIDFLFRHKIRASIRYALWLVVLVKLCVPPTLALPTSPAWWLHKTLAPVAVPHYTVTYDNGPLPEIPQTPLPVFVPPKPAMTNAAWLLVSSVLTSAALLIWLLARWWHIARQVRHSKNSVKLAAIVNETRPLAGMKPTVPVKLTANSMSPAVCGLFRPVILIPQSLAENFSDERLRAVLLHELVHLRRRDVWLNFLQALLQVVYWWHPLLWLANARIRRVREEAVDDTVMLALRDEAESYAPALLEVAKLALNRPLASLGLVGILESRSALRQRIERLVDFRPPQKAGLTFASLCGIFLFSAVAVPMGEAPAPAEKLNSTDAVAVEQQSLTVKVNPELFIQNVKAQAAKSLLSPTNDYTVILLDLLRSEGADCTPPHGIAFNTRTGEITTQNTPDKLDVFRRVIEQLNRADGVCELPLDHNPLRKPVLIEARVYQMPSADFDNFVSDLQYYHNRLYGDDWWSASPEKFKQLINNLESSGLQLIQRPRILTGSGMPAEFYVGNGTNSVEFDCKPFVAAGFIDLTLQGTVVSGAASATFTNYFNTKASAEDHGGIVVRVKKYGGDAGNNLVAVIGLEVITNAPAHFQERLRVAIPDKAVTASDLVRDAKLLYGMGKLDDSETKFKAALALNPDDTTPLYYLNLVQVAKAGQRPGMVQTQPGRKEILDKLNRVHFDQVIYDELPLSEVMRQMSEQTKLRDPEKKGINFLINPNPDTPGSINPTTGLPEAMTPTAAAAAPLDQVVITLNLTNVGLADLLDAIVKVADQPIKYSIMDYGVVFSSKGAQTPQLYVRTFKMDKTIFISGLKQLGGPGISIEETTNSAEAVSKLAVSVFRKLSVDFEPSSGKSVFYNDKLGLLFVRATESDLHTIERAIQAFNDPLPQIHIKAWFLEVPKGTLDGFGFTNIIGITNQPDELVGILTSENAKVAMKALESRYGAEELAEPEAITLSGRQVRMMATTLVSVVTNFAFTETASNVAVFPQVGTVTNGPFLDTVATVLPDGYTIDLKTTASVTTFMGYDQPTNTMPAVTRTGEKFSLPTVLPRLRVQQASTHLRLWDDQTVVLGNLPANFLVNGKQADGKPEEQDKAVVVFITATIVDPAGNRVHTDDEMPFAHTGVPPQAY